MNTFEAAITLSLGFHNILRTEGTDDLSPDDVQGTRKPPPVIFTLFLLSFQNTSKACIFSLSPQLCTLSISSLSQDVSNSCDVGRRKA